MSYEVYGWKVSDDKWRIKLMEWVYFIGGFFLGELVGIWIMAYLIAVKITDKTW